MLYATKNSGIDACKSAEPLVDVAPPYFVSVRLHMLTDYTSQLLGVTTALKYWLPLTYTTTVAILRLFGSPLPIC